MTLTKCCFLHRDYLNLYMTQLPRPIFQHVQQQFNCEDIAMSLYVSLLSGGKVPLLADGWAATSFVHLESNNSIHGSEQHMRTRHHCLNHFANLLGLKGRLQNSPIKRNNTEHDWFERGAASNPVQAITIDRFWTLKNKTDQWRTMKKEDLKILFYKRIPKPMRDWVDKQRSEAAAETST